MFKRILVAGLLSGTVLWATNGDNLIGSDAKSRAMGGVGVAGFSGNAAIYLNPSLLTQVSENEASADVTFFMPDVTAANAAMGSGESVKSESDFEIIPTVAYSSKYDELWSYGIGMFAISGMGVDYRDANPMSGLGGMKTKLQFARLIPSVAYNAGDFSVGAGLSIAYGRLLMQTDMPARVGGKMANDLGFGVTIGAQYSIGESWSIGATYQSEVAMEYDGVYDFNMDGNDDTFSLTQPAEAAVGIAYNGGVWRAEANLRHIGWSSAKGYDAFGWDDQTVIAIGGSYALESVVWRAGYNHASSPLDTKSFKESTVEGVPYGAMNIAFFDLAGFPAISETHYTAGASIDVADSTRVNLAVVYSPEAELAFNGIEATNKQISYSIGVSHRY